jgi:hypothetical protein
MNSLSAGQILEENRYYIFRRAKDSEGTKSVKLYKKGHDFDKINKIATQEIEILKKMVYLLYLTLLRIIQTFSVSLRNSKKRITCTFCSKICKEIHY